MYELHFPYYLTLEVIREDGAYKSGAETPSIGSTLAPRVQIVSYSVSSTSGMLHLSI
jgi:hypothetical protein